MPSNVSSRGKSRPPRPLTLSEPPHRTAAAPDGRRTEQPPHRTAAAPNGPDRLVNVEQGRWLARTIPGARGVILPDTGHGSIALPWEEVVGELVAAAG